MGGGAGNWAESDGNQLQTALRLAVEGENYARAGAIRDELTARRTAGVFIVLLSLCTYPSTTPSPTVQELQEGWRKVRG